MKPDATSPDQPRIRTLIVDDEPTARRGVRLMLAMTVRSKWWGRRPTDLRRWI